MDEVTRILESAKRLARRYRALTGRPLGITGEVAEHTAVRLLGLARSEVRQPGYDAIRRRAGKITRIQIKARCLVDTSQDGQRMGTIRLDRQWDSVLLVVLDRHLEPVQMYEADRPAVTKALLKPGSRSRNERGALAMNQFKRIAQPVWPKRSVWD